MIRLFKLTKNSKYLILAVGLTYAFNISIHFNPNDILETLVISSTKLIVRCILFFLAQKIKLQSCTVCVRIIEALLECL